VTIGSFGRRGLAPSTTQGNYGVYLIRTRVCAGMKHCEISANQRATHTLYLFSGEALGVEGQWNMWLIVSTTQQLDVHNFRHYAALGYTLTTLTTQIDNVYYLQLQ